MTTIELRFLANRYHGTGWGRHVNEGVAEWPPSPYRLLRAMYDVWKRKSAGLGEAEVKDVFSVLASHPPTFWLPKAVSAHTRSYLSSNTEDRSDKSLIFDAFVALHPDASCFLQWDLSLNGNQCRVLGELLSGLNYLGRSESWVEARLSNGKRGQFECNPAIDDPVSHNSYKRVSGDVVYVACPKAPSEYGEKLPWFEALAYSSGKLMKDRLSGPPAMQLVPYAMPSEAVTTWLPSRVKAPPRLLSAAVLELHGRVLPMATETVRISERVRGKLMRHFESKGRAQSIPAMIHGKDESGVPLKDHSHLFILPRANRLGRIDHVLILTRDPHGFADEVRDAVVNMNRLTWMEPIRVTTAWMGQADDHRIRSLTRNVISSTPFVTVRHWRKGRGSEAEFLKEEIRRECRNHGLPEPEKIEELERAGNFPGSKFRRNREGDPSRPGKAFRLTFEKEVTAPFSLGYGCHFGLGQFEQS